jgi:PAS domain S-box-containing protein
MTLRVVHPWRIDSQVVGFIEMGEEIDHIIHKLQDILGVELYVAIYKELLNREDWETGMRLFGHDSNWNQLPSSVIVSQTLKEVPQVFGDFLKKGHHRYMVMEKDIELTIDKHKHRFSVGVIPLFDASAREIGDIAVLYDITELVTSSRRTIVITFLICLIVGLALFIFFSKILGNVETELGKHRQHLEELVEVRTEELEKEINVRKKAEEAIRLSEEKFSKAFRSSPPWVTISALEDGRYIEVNDTFLRVSGYSIEEVIGRTSIELGIWAYPSDRAKMVKTLHEKGAIYNQEVRFRTKSGEILTMLRSVELIDIGGEKCSIAVTLDITARKRLEAQLLQAQKMEAIGELAGGVAHDFNNILTAIIGYGELLKVNIKEDDPQRIHIDQILASSDKAAHLIHNLLAFSRKQIINTQPVNLNKLVERIEKLLLRVIGEDIKLRTILAEEEVTVMADSGQIEQVLMNLATNARDAMPEGGLLIIETGLVEFDKEFIAAHEVVKPGKYALISVTDSGAGMDEATVGKVFEPFFTTKEVGKGTGLGLAMVYGIIKQHGGYIDVYSEEGKGTKFKIYLPLIKAEVKEEEISGLSDVQGGTETVLVAEDDKAVRELTGDVLKQFGYTVIVTEDGEDAVNKFRENKDKINLLLLDVIMPKKNGKKVYEEIKEINPDIKVLFLSGYQADILQKKGILEEGINFVQKPIKRNNLLRKVREVLDN